MVKKQLVGYNYNDNEIRKYLNLKLNKIINKRSIRNSYQNNIKRMFLKFNYHNKNK